MDTTVANTAMDATHFGTLDIAIGTILLLSCLIAFFRGFVREMLSLVAWVGAGLITVTCLPFVANMLKGSVSNPLVAYFCAAVGLYIGSIILISIINAIIMRLLKTGGGAVGMVDNFLGLGFGALRAAFMISLGFLILGAAMDKNNPPDFIQTSVLAPYGEAGGEFLGQIAPGYLEKLTPFLNDLKQKQQNATNAASNAASGARQAMPDFGGVRNSVGNARLPNGSDVRMLEGIINPHGKP